MAAETRVNNHTLKTPDRIMIICLRELSCIASTGVASEGPLYKKGAFCQRVSLGYHFDPSFIFSAYYPLYNRIIEAKQSRRK